MLRYLQRYVHHTSFSLLQAFAHRDQAQQQQNTNASNDDAIQHIFCPYHGKAHANTKNQRAANGEKRGFNSFAAAYDHWFSIHLSTGEEGD